MSARDELEAVIWRGLTLVFSGPTSYGAIVDGILDAADAYAVAVATATEDTAEATAVRRAILHRDGRQGRRRAS